jgi:hypothetical protein
MRSTLMASLAMVSILATTAAAQQTRQIQGSTAVHPTTNRLVQPPTKSKPPVSTTLPQGHGTQQPGGKINTKTIAGGQKTSNDSHGMTKGADNGSTKTTKLTSTTSKGSTQAQTAAQKQTKDGTSGSHTPADSSSITNNNINNNNTNVNVNVSNFNFGNPFFGGWAVGDAFLWGRGAWGFWGVPATWTLGLWSPIHEPIVLLP